MKNYTNDEINTLNAALLTLARTGTPDEIVRHITEEGYVVRRYPVVYDGPAISVPKQVRMTMNTYYAQHFARNMLIDSCNRMRDEMRADAKEARKEFNKASKKADKEGLCLPACVIKDFSERINRPKLFVTTTELKRMFKENKHLETPKDLMLLAKTCIKKGNREGWHSVLNTNIPTALDRLLPIDKWTENTGRKGKSPAEVAIKANESANTWLALLVQACIDCGTIDNPYVAIVSAD